MASSEESKLAERLRDERKRQGLTQEQLAKRAGLSRQGIIKIENGHSSLQLSSLRALAKALGVSAGWLLGRAA